MIDLNNVSRWYGVVIGLNDVTCKIESGITALLGQNGAGKSTLMRLVTGQIRPTTGEIRVFGEDPFSNPNVYRRLGYCPEIDNFYEHMSGRDFVRHLARLQGYSKAEAAERTEEMLSRVGMLDRADRVIQGYSKGMRQRIKLAQAMIHDPEIILLDEPLNGLDPVARREYMNLLGHLASEGKAIVVSSHILFEVEQMTRSILLLHRGRLLATGDIRVVRSLIDKHPHRIRIKSPDARQLATKLLDIRGVLSLSFPFGDQLLEVECATPELFYDRIQKLVLEEGLRIESMQSPDNNLESVFRYLVH
ncbi:MAG TPA: ABC transporter ATP-binding protein [Fimbriimonadaceae bacterium]|nr:ABC transporter ATP-binding protein [Fimbriimonadaceae bacterium]HRJ32651.1 ABC transporter ATP-binding protein [Fimbriimonadaceae bacterium]